MKYLLIILLSVLFISCREKAKEPSTEFNEKVVDFAIENSNNKLIELQSLYDSLPKEIADKDEDEKLVLAQILKKKGFKVVDWGSGNHPLGPRLVVLKLKKGDCECEVQKMYYSSDAFPEEIYRTTESIRCKNASR